MVKKGSRWNVFAIFKTEKDARIAARDLNKGGYAKVTKAAKSDYTKGSGWKVSTLWEPVMGKTNFFGEPMTRPKQRTKGKGRKRNIWR